MTEMIPAWVNGALTQVEKLEVHQRGLRHKAVSVFVMRGREVLLQRRALGKYHTPGLWANTCCTHPRWGEEPIHCAARRLAEELGIAGLPLQRAGGIEYRADVGKGLIEHEVVEVFSAQAPQNLIVAPDPAEVMDTRWVRLEDLEAEVAATPDRFTPWLQIYLAEGLGEAAL
jgi:isopentenyl-diphosphate delta-isomerase